MSAHTTMYAQLRLENVDWWGKWGWCELGGKVASGAEGVETQFFMELAGKLAK